MTEVQKYKVTNMDNDRKSGQQHECMGLAAITVASLLCTAVHICTHPFCLAPCYYPQASHAPKADLFSCSRDPVFSPSLSIAPNLQSLFFTIFVPSAMDLFHFLK